MMESFQWETAGLDNSLSLEASAGTGKTYTLERLVYRFVVEKKLPLEKILVVTFTNKAALELKERIRSLLWQQWEKAEGEEAALLKKACLDYDQASICTIHGFCQQVLRSFPLEMGIPLEMELTQDSQSLELELRDWLRKPSVEQDCLMQIGFEAAMAKAQNMENLLVSQIRLMDQYQDLQRAHWEPPLSTLDGYRDFLEGKNPLPELCRNWFSLLKPQGLHQQFLEAKLITRATKEKSLQAYWSLWDELSREDFSSESILKLSAKNKGDLFKYFRGKKEPHGESELSHTFEALKLEIELLDNRWGKNWMELLAKLFSLNWVKEITLERHNKRKSLTNLRFDDLIEGLYQALCGDTPSDDLLQALRNRYQVLLIDEFQDTDHRQWSIFKRIFHCNHRQFILIGDPKQSIYRFRGADLKIYYDAVEELPLGQRFQLDTNYRSTPNLIELFNQLFSSMFRNQLGELPVGYQDVKAPSAGKDELMMKGVLQPPLSLMELDCSEVSRCEDALDLWMEALADQVSHLLYSGNYTLGPEGVKPGDIAILMEQNRHCQSMQNLLSRRGITSVISGEGDIFVSPAFDMIEQFLLLLAHPWELNALRFLLLSPLMGLDAQELLSGEEGGILQQFSLELRVLRQRNLSLESLFLSFFGECSSGDKLYQMGAIGEDRRDQLNRDLWERLLALPSGERIYTDFFHLIDLFQREMDRESLDLQDLHRLALSPSFRAKLSEEKKQRLERDGQAVQIMTHHSSKGLQFGLVFFCGAQFSSLLQKNSPWYSFQRDGQRHVDLLKRDSNGDAALIEAWEEKMKLYYVSFTRAKSRLYLPLFKGFDKSWLSYLYRSFCSEEIISPGAAQKLLNARSGEGLPGSGELLVEELERRCPHLYTLEEPPQDSCDPPSHEDLELHHLTWSAGDLTGRFPRMSSFSSLSRQLHREELLQIEGGDRPREEQPAVVEPVPYQEREILRSRDLPGGAMVGNLVHRCFEELDFRWATKDWDLFEKDDDVEAILSELSLQYYPRTWYQKWSGPLKEMVYQTLRASLKELGDWSLSRLTPQEKRHELEFHMPVKEGRLRLDKNYWTIKDGYLKGYLDLIFIKDGRYYIADWKTTSQQGRPDQGGYGEEELQEMMVHHQYHLQAKIYWSALGRYLKSVMGDSFRREMLGGIYYFFLRGMDEPGQGVWFHRPDDGEHRSFEESFLEEVPHGDLG